MYRKRNGSRGFSMTKFAHAVIPNFFEDEAIPRLDSLQPQRHDMLYYHQIHKSNPYALDENSCYAGGIVDTEGLSKKVFKCLQKAQICDKEGLVDTSKIDGKKFMHQILIIDNRRQRELVNMLFWWEEECARLRALISDEDDLARTIEGIESGRRKPVNCTTQDQSARLDTDTADLNAEEGDEYPDDDIDRKHMLDEARFARERIRMRIRQKPSQRRADVEAGEDDLADQARTHPVPAVPEGIAQEKPPMYYS
ncbi:hypothetical protein LTR66_016037 [Elasticomyces elasticus]|nr:hypothetical protein LTR66_016037 [Elasticomyces elasticus]